MLLSDLLIRSGDNKYIFINRPLAIINIPSIPHVSIPITKYVILINLFELFVTCPDMI